MELQRNYRTINIAANCLLIIVGASLLGILAYRTLFNPSLASLEAELLKAGDEFKGLPEFDFRKSPNTLLIAIDADCQYCIAAIPFFKKLVHEGRDDSSVRIIAMFQNKEEDTKHFLSEHGLEVEFIANTDLAALRVNATPTVIWVDADRKILAAYEGLFQENQEAQFFAIYETRLSSK